MNQMLALIIKETKLLLREAGSLVLLFCIPAIFILALSVALQGAFTAADSKNEKIALLTVNEDRGKSGAWIVEEIRKTGKFSCITERDGKALTREGALASIHEGKAEIALVIPAKASEALSLPIKAEIELLVDPALGHEFTSFVRSTVQNFTYLAIIGKLRGVTIDTADTSKGLYVRQTYITGAGTEVNPNSVQQNVPGWTIFALFWIAQTIALGMVNERLSGVHRRIMVSPISWGRYITGKVFPFFVLNLLQAAFLFAMGKYLLPLFGCPALEIKNIPALAFLTVAVSFTSICMGLFFAALGRTLFSVATLSVAVLVVMTIIAGIMVPRIVMPAFMQKLSYAVPQGWALTGYQDILVRDAGIATILPHAGAVALFGCCFAAVAIILFRRELPRRS